MLESRLERAEARVSSAEARIRELDAVANNLSEAVVAREREIVSLKRRLRSQDPVSAAQALRFDGEDAAEPSAEQLEARQMFDADMTAVLARIENLHAQACAQSTRMRMQAVRDAIDLAAEGAGIELDRGQLLADGESDAAGTGPFENARGHMYAGSIDVDIGPVDDFVQLARLEDAAGAIQGAGKVEVKSFTEGRALLRMHLAEPVELLRELESRSDLEFKISAAGTSSVTLDLDR